MKNRREFLKQSTGLLGLSVLDFNKANKPLLSFSTLGCPSWDFSQVLQHATQNQYSGIEIRGIKGNLDLPALPIFSQANIAATRRQVADAGLKIINLGSSANMHFLDSKKRQSNLDEAKKFIDLAFNQMHHCKNVFVTDGSCMTSTSTQNPSLTYMALTARAVDYAIGEKKKRNL